MCSICEYAHIHRVCKLMLVLGSGRGCVVLVSTVRSMTATRQHLLILDLNGLLLHRQYQFATQGQCGGCATHQRAHPDAISNGFAIYLRPNAPEFLQWCHDHFVVALWSTCKRQNLQPLLELLYAGLDGHNPDMILSQEDCFNTRIMHPTSPTKPILAKLMSSVWKKVQQQGSSPVCEFAAHNTLLIDDAPYKAIGNNRYTSVHPNPWHPDTPNKNVPSIAKDGILRALLTSILTSVDVRPLIKDFERTVTDNIRFPLFKVCENDATFAYLRHAWQTPSLRRNLELFQDLDKEHENKHERPQQKRTRRV